MAEIYKSFAAKFYNLTGEFRDIDLNDVSNSSLRIDILFIVYHKNNTFH